MDQAEIAERYGVHRHTVADWLGRMAVPVRRPGLSPADLPRAAELYQAGWSLARVAEHFGCNGETARRALRTSGVQLRPRSGCTYLSVASQIQPLATLRSATCVPAGVTYERVAVVGVSVPDKERVVLSVVSPALTVRVAALFAMSVVVAALDPSGQ